MRGQCIHARTRVHECTWPASKQNRAALTHTTFHMQASQFSSASSKRGRAPVRQLFQARAPVHTKEGMRAPVQLRSARQAVQSKAEVLGGLVDSCRAVAVMLSTSPRAKTLALFRMISLLGLRSISSSRSVIFSTAVPAGPAAAGII